MNPNCSFINVLDSVLINKFCNKLLKDQLITLAIAMMIKLDGFTKSWCIGVIINFCGEMINIIIFTNFDFRVYGLTCFPCMLKYWVGQKVHLGFSVTSRVNILANSIVESNSFISIYH